ncbi:MAG: glycosyltransferase [Deltaproteobacteria bacterium]|nr:glycosyltransferase [Deltaproteobacteria bacterium]
MPPTVREVFVERGSRLRGYRAIEGLEGPVATLAEKAREVSHLLGSRRVWMINSTRSGGGVAEMLPRMCALMNELGVDTRWLVLEPDDPAFFRVTKGLHNLLHGEPGLDDVEEARKIFDRISQAAAWHLREHVVSGDVLAVHDPQPVGVAACLMPEHRPTLLWRCHIGLPYHNESTRRGWDFLRPYLVPFRRMVFSAESYIPDEYLPRRAVLHPGIDPLSHKNRELRPYKLVGILRSVGLLEGPPVPAWAEFKARAQRWAAGRWEATPIPGLLHRPALVQVSRFDRLKGFQYLIPGFAQMVRAGPERAQHLRVDTSRARSELAQVQLVLAGPDPSGVLDDPEGASVLEELTGQQSALPPEIGARVHLVRLPMEDLKQNALTVNALQRVAAAVLQNSIKEGFGLTVSEALWKGTPVVAANVGGIKVQVRHRRDGLLVDDPSDPAALAEAMVQVLAYPKDAELMACCGRARVREHFLVIAQLTKWMDELRSLLQAPAEPPAPSASAEVPPAA